MAKSEKSIQQIVADLQAVKAVSGAKLNRLQAIVRAAVQAINRELQPAKQPPADGPVAQPEDRAALAVATPDVATPNIVTPDVVTPAAIAEAVVAPPSLPEPVAATPVQPVNEQPARSTWQETWQETWQQVRQSPATTRLQTQLTKLDARLTARYGEPYLAAKRSAATTTQTARSWYATKYAEAAASGVAPLEQKQAKLEVKASRAGAGAAHKEQEVKRLVKELWQTVTKFG